MRHTAVALCWWSLIACASSDIRPRLESGDVHVAFVQVTSVTRGSYATRRSWGAAMRDALGFDGMHRSTVVGDIDASVFLCARGALYGEYPEDVVHEFVTDHDRVELERGWSEANGETLCRLYRDATGRKDLLLCQLYSSQLSASAASIAGARVVEKQTDALHVGVKCPEHDEWVLLFVLPSDLADGASAVLAQVLANAEARPLWCAKGSHAVAAPDTE